MKTAIYEKCGILSQQQKATSDVYIKTHKSYHAFYEQWNRIIY